MIPSLDGLIHRDYHLDHYNCAHFACDVWEILYNSAMAETLACFLLPHKDRYASPEIRKQFVIVKDRHKTGDIVVLHRTTGDAHVAICYKNEYIQIVESGVQIVSWRILKIGFSRAKVYRHVQQNNSFYL